MIYRNFHGTEVSALGMGVLRLPVDEANPKLFDRKASERVIDACFDHGINYFDTAYTYQGGDSERLIGELFSRRPRDSYLLATKYYAAAGKPIEEVFEEQRRRCRTDYFDFYLFHSLDENYYADYTREENLAFLLKKKQEGKIRWIGFSSHASPDTLEKFLNVYDGFDMAQIQLNYLDWKMLDAKRQYELLTMHGIPVWVMEPLKGGRLVQLSEKPAEILRRCAPERSLSEWGFGFLKGLKNVHTVLSGMNSVEQVEENAKIFSESTPISAPEQEVLAQAAKLYLNDLGVPCSACRYCCEVCPAELDIPLLIRAYNEQRVAGATWRVGGLSDAKGAEHCLQCGTCLTRCPQKIDIPDVLAQFARLPR